MSKKTQRILAVLLIIMTVIRLFAGCGAAQSGEEKDNNGTVGASGEFTAYEYTENDLDASYDESSAVKITLSGSGAQADGAGAEINGSTVTVTAAGVYIISGSLDDGQIIVDAEKSDKIQLVLSGCDITCKNGAPIYIKQADKVFITLAENTVNTLTDTADYIFAAGEDEPDAALFSKDDLTINGGGTLNINANYNHGIHGKDDIVITGGVLNITSVNDGIKGKDLVAVTNADITVNAGGDGIQSSNDTDTALGRVYIDGGSLDITAAQDGIQAETVLTVTGGVLNITTGGGSENASYKSETAGGRGSWGSWGSWGRDTNGTGDTSAETSDSAKALKSETATAICGGNINIDSSDDAIHSNGSVYIQGGEITISSGDDGIHADSEVSLTGGKITVNASYEGIEGSVITADGTDIYIYAYDDGFNAAGGNDSSAVGTRPGADNFASNENCSITINSGSITINAAGDGIDSNGNLYVNGGTTYVWGPTDSADGALDYAGEAVITGGTFVAAGSSGMAQGFGENSTQYSFLAYTDSRAGAEEVSLTDEAGDIIMSFTPPKNWSSVVISAPQLTDGKAYLLTSGGATLAEITLSGITTTYGSGGFGGNMPGGRNPGSMPDDLPEDIPQGGFPDRSGD